MRGTVVGSGEGAAVDGSVTVTVDGSTAVMGTVMTDGSVTVAVADSMTVIAGGPVTAGVDGSGISMMENGVEAAVNSSDSEFEEAESMFMFIGGRARRG